MNTQNAIIGVVALVVLSVGGYSIYNATNGTSTANVAAVAQTGTPTQPVATTDGTTPQVQGQDVKVGTGREAKPGDLVSVLYAGKFTDGTVFDSSAAHNNEPLKFVLGSDGLIPGFQIGVNGMKEGGQRLLSIPPELGYGTQDVKDASGKVIIPANSTLIFEIQLEKVENAPAQAPAPATTGTNQ